MAGDHQAGRRNGQSLRWPGDAPAAPCAGPLGPHRFSLPEYAYVCTDDRSHHDAPPEVVCTTDPGEAEPPQAVTKAMCDGANYFASPGRATITQVSSGPKYCPKRSVDDRPGYRCTF
jgi:hypothetical protein